MNDATPLSAPRRLFGTDGIRGTANEWPMTAGLAMRLGQAAGCRFARGTASHRARAVIGKDTRLSNYMLEPALTSGLVSAGMDVMLVGPMPTPAVAMLTRSLRADLGVMLSASHNPFEDNGIKLFGPDGNKLSDAEEAEIERLMAELPKLATPARLGRVQRLEDAQGRYIESAKATFPRGLRLDGLRVVIDCAHGAAYRVAPTVLSELGATVMPVGTAPDGLNINSGCGSTVPEFLARQVMTHGADIGVALDGDADRLVLADEAGEIVNGDQILALIADTWGASGRLAGGGVVATVMSNLGLERHLAGKAMRLVRTKVGDRYVAEAMRAGGFNVGGEQSGHMILSDYGTTGDGLVAALQVLAALIEDGRPASQVTRRFAPLPQVLRSVRFGGGAPLELPVVAAAIAEAEARLAGSGRLLIRKSGTEPVIRVMAEGEDEALVARIVEELVALIGAHAAPPAADGQ